MMFKAILLAIIEGLTEFIPVSSTGHLILVGNIINFSGDFSDMYKVVIQLAAILAVIILYIDKLKLSIIDFFKYIISRDENNKGGFIFCINIVMGSIPITIIGLLLYDKIKSLFIIETVIIGFILGGILLLIAEIFLKNKNIKVKNVDDITLVQSFKIGIIQLLSIWPGMSRSASTIIGGWVVGLSTPISTEFSFYLAIPAIVGSSLIDLFKYDYSIMTPSLWSSFIVGFCVAFIVSLVVLKKFLEYLKRKPLIPFSIYRIIAGCILGTLFIFNKITT